jgi:hypothetical protein
MTKTTVGMFDNDAKSCFDRTLTNVFNLTAQQLGMSKEVCKTHADLLAKARYRIKTTLGLSQAMYLNSKDQPIYGPGQGGSASAHIWAIVSSVMLEIMKRERDGVTIADPTIATRMRRVMDAFVDDTTGNKFIEQLMGMDNKIGLHKVLEELTATAQLWERLLTASGGALELSKCFYYIVHWIWEGGNARLARLDELNKKIELTDSITNERVSVRAKETNESHKTLGIFLNPTGDFSDEIK